MLQMMPPPLSFFFFSSSRLSPTATARLRDEWWVDSLFLLLWLPRRDFCSLFLLLWLSFRNFRWIFREERLGRKDTWKSKFAAATFEPLILITFHHWKFFAGDWTQVCSLIMSLMHLLLISIDADMKSEIGSTRRYLVALSLEVPCRGSWCRCQTYPTWAPRGHLPS